MTHGTRQTYKSGCRCRFCRAAEAMYRASLRRQHAVGTQPLGALVDAAMTRRLVKGMLVEGFTFAEIARRVGLKCGRFRLHTDRVTRRKYLQLRRLYRQIVLEPPHEEAREA